MADGPEDALVVSGRGRAVELGLRRRAVAAVVQDGMSTRAAAARFGLSAPSISRWVKRFRERGHVRPEPQGGGRPSLVAAERDRIVRILEARPELSSRALSEALAAEGVRFSDRTLRGFLKRHRMELSRRRAVRRQRKRWKASGG
ncbi:MAG: helix-turn-helix domain-containing protein [Alphaproteobacteria bacterium]|nr:helix-turn-helix domain-containing protein [Alphaproteobacteria bacterium]